jgi:hypothetical protein
MPGEQTKPIPAVVAKTDVSYFQRFEGANSLRNLKQVLWTDVLPVMVVDSHTKP